LGRLFPWILICILLAGAAPGLVSAPAKDRDAPVLVVQASSSNGKDGKESETEVERFQKDLAQLGRDLSKAIAEGNKKAADAIFSAIDKTKEQLKKATDSEKKDNAKNK
jgi:seryl-tRNA synthetase